MPAIAITAVWQVLPAMIDRGHGTLLVSTGAWDVYTTRTEPEHRYDVL
jgi:hypothetical protein